MSTDSIKVGDKAPDFTLEASKGRTVSSADLSGKPYLLYFYRKRIRPAAPRRPAAFRKRFLRLESWISR